MDNEQGSFKYLAAIALGAIGGLVLGSFIFGGANKGGLSKHLATLSKVLEQIEGIDTEEAQDLKGRIHTILNTIESSYVSNKK